MNTVDRIDEKRKSDFMEKQEHFERIRESHMQQQEQERLVQSHRVLQCPVIPWHSSAQYYHPQEFLSHISLSMYFHCFIALANVV